MKYQPDRGTETNDEVYTPRPIAKRIIDHFKMSGRILDPAMGDGAFYDQFQTNDKDWCEVTRGRNFFQYRAKCDWCCTNPPWSLFRQFLVHAMEISDNIVFLITVNHVWTKSRLRELKAGGFGIREIFLIDTPANFPHSGFQVCAIHFKRGYDGEIRLSEDDAMVQGTLNLWG